MKILFFIGKLLLFIIMFGEVNFCLGKNCFCGIIFFIVCRCWLSVCIFGFDCILISIFGFRVLVGFIWNWLYLLMFGLDCGVFGLMLNIWNVLGEMFLFFRVVLFVDLILGLVIWCDKLRIFVVWFWVFIVIEYGGGGEEMVEDKLWWIFGIFNMGWLVMGGELVVGGNGEFILFEFGLCNFCNWFVILKDVLWIDVLFWGDWVWIFCEGCNDFLNCVCWNLMRGGGVFIRGGGFVVLLGFGWLIFVFIFDEYKWGEFLCIGCDLCSDDLFGNGVCWIVDIIDVEVGIEDWINEIGGMFDLLMEYCGNWFWKWLGGKEVVFEILVFWIGIFVDCGFDGIIFFFVKYCIFVKRFFLMVIERVIFFVFFLWIFFMCWNIICLFLCLNFLYLGYVLMKNLLCCFFRCE